MGFIIVFNQKFVILAVTKGAMLDNQTHVEIATIDWALEICKSKDLKPNKVCCDSAGVTQMIKRYEHCVAWHYKDEIQNLKQKLQIFPSLLLECINWEANLIADALALHGRRNPHLSLLFQGLERPRWLEDLCLHSNLVF